MSGTRRPFGLSTAKLTEHSQITGPMGLSATKARPDGLSQSDGGYVTIQLYKNISNRDVKILELEFSISTQMDVVFNTITNHFPNDYMFDGPMYAGSGMIVIRNCMYVVGPEDYSIPYMSWLAGQKDVPDLEVVGMSSVILGNIPDLMNICLANEACFLVFNGDEELRIFFSNFTNASTRPNVVFKRRIPRVTRCVLCTSRAADLVIVDDEMLPRNPSHCCSSCYRRIRSNTDGHFVPPAPNVIVSVYKQV
jgi:hypothetical protein